jgi:hypothetical protein
MVWNHDTTLRPLKLFKPINATPCSQCKVTRRCIRWTLEPSFDADKAVQLCAKCILEALYIFLGIDRTRRLYKRTTLPDD